MSYVLDLIILLFISLVVWLSAKKGFLHTVVVLAGYILMIIILSFAPAKISDVVYDKAVFPQVESYLNESIDEDAQQEEIEQKVDEIWDKMPVLITETASSLGYSKEYVAGMFENNINKQETIKQIEATVFRPTVLSIIKLIITILLFVLCVILIKLIAKLFKNVKIPVISKVNSLLGGVLGFVKGVALSIVLVYIIAALLPYAEHSLKFTTKELINNSYLFSFIYNFNILSII